MSKKLTKVDKFNLLKDLVKDNADMVEFIDHEIELLSKKNGSRKMSANQLANENVKVKVLDFMEIGKDYTVTEIQKGVGLESNQKASALITQLKNENLITRNEIKGRAYFCKV